jgi:glycosyltransferase involved in cell wall biosynthesis
MVGSTPCVTNRRVQPFPQGQASTPATEPRILLYADPDVTLHLPDGDAENPEVSIVIPALNEELTIADFVEWCKAGLAAAGVEGEIVIIDSSADRTAEIALAHGARVLKTPKRGLGRAYIDAIPHIRGKYVLMGDADCTYDFSELKPFVAGFHEGYEFVMGSRWRGSIADGAMPPLHQYLGTPVTTFILNVLYSGRFTDIHCGMRGITRDALVRMELSSQSWEYASEMVLKSIHMKLRTTEVPVHFLADREGRLSHHKRAGWFSPWQAAWINLRAMFIYGLNFFAFKPGLFFMAIGLLVTAPATFGPVTVGPVGISLHWMLLGLALWVVGLQSFYLGCIAQILYDWSGAARQRWARVFPYTRTVILSVALFAAGVALALPLAWSYVEHGLALTAVTRESHMATMGLLLVVTGFVTFISTLLLHAVSLHVKR